ncbi:MAG: hypothetical protein AB7T49_15570 [Oligoflexales bacterium]
MRRRTTNAAGNVHWLVLRTACFVSYNKYIFTRAMKRKLRSLDEMARRITCAPVRNSPVAGR